MPGFSDHKRNRFRSGARWLSASLSCFLALGLAGCRCAPPIISAPPSQPETTNSHTGNNSDSQAGFELYFLNVGKGDCALLRLPEGKWAMVDTGPPKGLPAVLGMLSVLKVDKLEAIFISHPHNDHAGGLEDILDRAACPVIYTTPADFGKPTSILKETAASRNVSIQSMTSGQAVRIAGVSFTALGPNATFPEENDNSLVLMLEHNGVKALFPGDQLAQAEASLLAKGFQVKCDILKVGHHGEGDASSEAFLSAASPKYCVIPTSGKPSDAPGAEVLQRLGGIKAMTRITGTDGTLRFSSVPMSLEAITPAEPPAALVIHEIDVEKEYVGISNPTSQDADMTGWCLISEKGSQYYLFPAGTRIPGGGSVRVYSGMDRNDFPGGLFWTDKKIWQNKKADRAILMDPYGRIVSTR